MKIKINDSESYEIAIPDEIEGDEFIGIVDRLVRIQRLFVKDVVSNLKPNVTSTAPMPGVRRPRGKHNDYSAWKSSKEKTIALIKSYYTGGKDTAEIDEFKNKFDYYGDRAKMLGAPMKMLREFHNIQPEEVNLIRWPRVADTHRMDALRIKKEVEENARTNR